MSGAGPKPILDRLKATLPICDLVIATHVTGYKQPEHNTDARHNILKTLLDNTEPCKNPDRANRINSLAGNLKSEFRQFSNYKNNNITNKISHTNAHTVQKEEQSVS